MSAFWQRHVLCRHINIERYTNVVVLYFDWTRLCFVFNLFSMLLFFSTLLSVYLVIPSFLIVILITCLVSSENVKVSIASIYQGPFTFVIKLSQYYIYIYTAVRFVEWVEYKATNFKLALHSISVDWQDKISWNVINLRTAWFCNQMSWVIKTLVVNLGIVIISLVDHFTRNAMRIKMIGIYLHSALWLWTTGHYN